MNTVRLTGRFDGRPLAPGTYRIAVIAVRGKTRTSLGRISVQVVPPGRRLRSTRGAPPAFHCVAARPLPVTLAASTLGPGADLLRPGARLRPPVLKPPGGFSFPRVHLRPGSDGSLSISIIGLLLYAALGVAGAVLIVSVVRFFRGISNP